MSTRWGLMLVGAGLLAGCGDLDPYRKPYAWHPTGANQANIAAMVANPQDLIRGRGSALTGSEPAILAIGRVRQDQPKPIAATGGGGQGTGYGGNSGGGAAGGGSGTAPGSGGS